MARAARVWNEPMLIPAAGMCCGVLLDRFTEFAPGEASWPLAAFTILALLPGAKSRKRLCTGLAAAALGILSARLHAPGPKPVIDATGVETVVLEGCVVEPAALSENREQFTLELAPEARARVTLHLREGQAPPNLRYGQRVEFEGRARTPHNFGNPGAFDFENYLAQRNIFWNVSTRTGAEVTILPGTCGNTWERWIFGVRSAALERLDRLYAGDAYKARMMQAVLLGETARLERSWTEDYRRTGTYHALVVSGLHLTLLAGNVLLLLRAGTGRHGFSLSLALVICWLFALAAGMMAPVARAAGGFTLFLLARFYFRDTRILNITSVVVAVFLLADPAQLFEGSFQLSVLSVLAIGGLAEPLFENSTRPMMKGFFHLRLDRADLDLPVWVSVLRVEAMLLAKTVSLWTGFSRKTTEPMVAAWVRGVVTLSEIFVVSAVVQLALLLPMALFFHRVSLSGLAANVLVVPIMNAVVLAGFAAVLTNSSWLASGAGALLELARWIAAGFAALEPNWRIPDPPLWLALGIAAALVVLAFCARVRGWPRLAAAGGVLGLSAMLLLHPFPPQFEAGRLEVTAIDVGQGDSILVVSPLGRTLLVDAGGTPGFKGRPKPKLDIGEDVVSAYLWTRSLQQLDAVALTHAHEDHSGGLASVIANFRPKELWVGAMGESDTWRGVRELAAQHNVKIVPRLSGEQIDFDGAAIRVLAPFADYKPEPTARNNDSLVMSVHLGERGFLLTGDAEKELEFRIAGEPLLLAPLDVLKLGHHGSRTSTTAELLEAARPAFAVVSAGFENLYRHPHPDVLARLKERGVRIIRTDTGGQVQFLTDGRRLEKRAYNRQLAAMQ